MISPSSRPIALFKEHTEDVVLDLCVRPTKPRSSSPSKGFQCYDRGSIEEPEGLPALFLPHIAKDTNYSARMAILQQRLSDEPLYSPRTSSSPDSYGHCNSLADTSSHFTPISTRAGKPTRPFKAYPKDPLSVVSPANEGLCPDSNDAYVEFRRRMLEQVHAATRGNAGNKNMKRPVLSVSPNQQPSSSMDSRDSAYWERRRKNNEAAKRSRDARRAKEDEIAIRAAFLEQENVKLKYEVAALRSETNRLRCMLFPG